MSELKISGFKIIEKIGEGGMATVWKATQESLDRLVAIKVLSPKLASNKEDIDLFRKEAQSAAKLKHSGIIQVYDARTDDGLYSLVMEFIDGYTVGDWQRRKQILDEENVVLVSESVAMALEYAWNTNKIIHCDIKPDNIMIDSDGTVKLADLGLSRTISNLDAAQDLEEVMGTPSYMSPEQVQGEIQIDCRSDIYSLGATMYHLITGKMLFEGYSDEQVMEMQLYEVPPPAKSFNNDISQGLSDLISLMLEKDPQKRPKDWRVVINKLHKVKAGDKITNNKVLIDPAITRKEKSNKKRISIKQRPNQVNRSSASPITEVTKKESSYKSIVFFVTLIIAGVLIFWGINHERKVRHRQELERIESAKHSAQVQNDQTTYNAILTYYNNNPKSFAYVISKLNEFKQKAKTDTYIELSTEKTRVLQRQYDIEVDKEREALERQSEKYMSQGDLLKAQEIYTSYRGAFSKETADFRKQKTDQIQKLIEQEKRELEQEKLANSSIKKVIESTLSKTLTLSPSTAKEFLQKQIKEKPELAEHNTIKQLNEILDLLDTKAVIVSSYEKIRQSGEPIVLKTKIRDIPAKIKSIEDSGLNISLLNSDGIINSSTFILFSQLTVEEIDARLKDNRDAYNIKKGVEYARNSLYDMAEMYFRCLPKKYAKLMLLSINQDSKRADKLKAEEDLIRVFQAFNVEIFTFDDLAKATQPNLSEAQIQKLRTTINAWESEYPQSLSGEQMQKLRSTINAWESEQ